MMLNWIKRLFGFRVSFKSRTPVIDGKFPRLKTLDRRVAAAREIEHEWDADATGLIDTCKKCGKQRA